MKPDDGSGDHSARVLIGWKEYAALPELGIRRVKAKIDTGARSSALDVSSYDLTEKEGCVTARLRLAYNRKDPNDIAIVEVPVLRMVVVCNSSGIREQRPLIETAICLGAVQARIRVTLTNRASMRFRMILGRQALAGRFVVDVSQQYLLGRVSRRRPGAF